MSFLQRLLQECIRDPGELAKRFSMSMQEEEALRDIAEKYPVCVPPYYLNLIGEDYHTDPIRRMCIPDPLEFSLSGEEDTSGEKTNTVVRGMQHKYGPTALVLTTNQCSMYCRHCFRKRMVGSDAEEIAGHLGEMVEYVKAHPEINNILLSGGDALINENKRIAQYLATFSALPNIQYIRIGTRTPVVLPERIYGDAELLSILQDYGKEKQILIVTHFNHPREITSEAARAVRSLLAAGCPVRNQTVLLRGINDDPKVLSDLFNSLVSIGVLPYYLFQCRPAMGVVHQFQVPILTGSKIVKEAKKTMSGQAKAFRYCMSHVTGKIEILGCPEKEGEMLFCYHQAKKEEDASRFFTLHLSEDQCWL